MPYFLQKIQVKKLIVSSAAILLGALRVKSIVVYVQKTLIAFNSLIFSTNYPTMQDQSGSQIIPRFQSI